MYVYYPLFYFLNGITTHKILQFSSSVYKTSPYAIQHEIIGRWNNSLTQILLAILIFRSNTLEDVEMVSSFFQVYLLTDVAHMLLYCYDWIYYLHHIIPILVHYTLWNTLSFESTAALTYTTGILELTTPPISLVWTLSKLNIKGSYSFYASIFAYLNFVGLRILYFPYFWYTDLPFLCQLITFPYHFMNVFWFGKMTSYVLKTNQ